MSEDYVRFTGWGSIEDALSGKMSHLFAYMCVYNVEGVFHKEEVMWSWTMRRKDSHATGKIGGGYELTKYVGYHTDKKVFLYVNNGGHERIWKFMVELINKGLWTKAWHGAWLLKSRFPEKDLFTKTKTSAWGFGLEEREGPEMYQQGIYEVGVTPDGGYIWRQKTDNNVRRKRKVEMIKKTGKGGVLKKKVKR